MRDPINQIKTHLTIFDLCEINKDGSHRVPYSRDTNPSWQILDNRRAFKGYRDNDYQGDMIAFYGAQHRFNSIDDFPQILRSLAEKADISVDVDIFSEARSDKRQLIDNSLPTSSLPLYSQWERKDSLFHSHTRQRTDQI